MKYKLLLFAFSALLLAAIVWLSDPGEMTGHLAKADYRYILLGFAVATASLLLRVMKWKVLLNDIGFVQLLPVQLLGITISNFTPGKAAEPFKAVLLKAKEKRSVSSVMPSIVWERIIDVIVLVLASLFLLFIVSEELLLAAYVSIGLFSVVVVAALVLMHNESLGTVMFNFMRKFPFLNRVDGSFIKNFYSEKIPTKNILVSLAVTSGVWALDGMVLYVALRSVGVDVAPAYLVGILALSTLIGVISFLPGGIGSSEFVMLVMLGHLGVEQAVALSGIILMRLMTLWYSTLLGYLSFVYMTRKLNISIRL
ncbi:MAG: flippase-like domain-containing protein [Candidatus Aenigmarchaeota archaeon]|nr:flippase-like domain-containing protein [Candidatus Aenigmarchaeota archaeon]